MEIFADSCCDLTPEQIAEYGIHIIPLNVFVANKSYQDTINITTPQLFEIVNQTGVLPKTSAPSIASLMEAFKPFKEILFFSISSKLSATYQDAMVAAKSLPDSDIRVIDSLNLSTGIGLLILRAIDMKAHGKSMDEIEKEIDFLKEKVNTSFVIDTLDYIYMGGRCSGTERLIGSILKIRPVIEVNRDGTLGIKEKISGSRKKALDSMLLDFKNKLPNIDLHRVFITHTLCHDDAEYLKSELMKLAQIDEICETVANSTIACHCGPKTIGILFLSK